MKFEKFYDSSFGLIRPIWLKNKLGNAAGNNVKIAVIDSGCSLYQKEDSRVLKGISLISGKEKFKYEIGENYSDNLGHGSACIDIIFQIAPNAEVIPIKVFNSTLETGTDILVEAINYAVNKETDIINLSLGTKLEEALYPLYAVCEKAKNKNIICVASNANSDINSYPAIFENVISVGSSKVKDKFDFIYCEDELCECLADGFPKDVYYTHGQRTALNGNSFAAPIITGLIALFIEKFGKLTLQEIKSLLKSFSINEREVN